MKNEKHLTQILAMKKNQFYKGLNENWADCYTGQTKYRKNKIIRIEENKRRAKLCTDGVLHASKKIENCIEFSSSTQFCIVEGIPVISDGIKLGFYEYKVIRRLAHKEIGKILKMNFDLRSITHFFKRKRVVRKADIRLLHKWASVRDSIWGSVYESVNTPVRSSIWDSVWNSVWNSVSDSVRDLVWDSVNAFDNVSIWPLIWLAVRASIYAYLGSLFTYVKRWKYIKHKKGEYPFESAVELLKRGLMPIITKKKQYILSGPKFEVIYEEDI